MKITVQIPEGVSSVKPQVHPGWKIKIQKKKPAKAAMAHEAEKAVSEVSWGGGELPDEYMDEFGLSVKLPDGEGHGDHAEQLAAPSLTQTRGHAPPLTPIPLERNALSY